MMEFMNIKDLKTTEWLRLGKKEGKQPEVVYDEYMDVLSMYFVPVAKKERILIYFIDKYASLLFRAADNEAVGIRFEAFRKSFFPAHLNKQWSLGDTKVTLDGIRDLRFIIQAVEEPKPALHYTIPKPIDKSVSMEPVYA